MKAKKGGTTTNLGSKLPNPTVALKGQGEDMDPSSILERNRRRILALRAAYLSSKHDRVAVCRCLLCYLLWTRRGPLISVLLSTHRPKRPRTSPVLAPTKERIEKVNQRVE